MAHDALEALGRLWEFLWDFNTHVTLFGRMMFLWSFVIGGILLAVQASQFGEDDSQRIWWTRLTDESR